MDTLTESISWIFGLSISRYFIVAGIFFALFYVLLPAKFNRFMIQQKTGSKKDFVREIWHSLQTTITLGIIACLIVFTPLKNYTRMYSNINDYRLWWIPLSIFLGLAIHDTYFYWMHRLLHHSGLFKTIHLLHHKSKTPSPWTSYSFSFIEGWTEGSVLFIIAAILPMHLISFELFILTAFIINVYGHLGFEIAPLWFRKTWIFEITNTSVYHNLHHLKFKGNYGLYTRIWDRLMGTEIKDYVNEYDRIQQKRISQKHGR